MNAIKPESYREDIIQRVRAVFIAYIKVTPSFPNVVLMSRQDREELSAWIDKYNSLGADLTIRTTQNLNVLMGMEVIVAESPIRVLFDATKPKPAPQ
jgi:hypothetical protein